MKPKSTIQIFSLVIIVIFIIFSTMVIIHLSEERLSISDFNKDNSYSLSFEFDNKCKFKKGDLLGMQQYLIGIVDSVIKINDTTYYVKSLIFNQYKVPQGSIYEQIEHESYREIKIYPSDNKLMQLPGSTIEIRFNYEKTQHVHL